MMEEIRKKKKKKVLIKINNFVYLESGTGIAYQQIV